MVFIPPNSPNWNPANSPGQLTTNRYDFQNHIDGYSFRHQANQIDLFPTLVVGSTTYTDVQDILSALTTAVDNFSVSSATVGTSSSNLGVITLGGDLGGIALNPKVVALQNFPINTIPPSLNNVLTWGGSSWGPAPPQGSFTAAGDLVGNASSQSVVGLTGSGSSPSKTVIATNDVIQFINTATPQILQANAITNTAGSNITIRAQHTNKANAGSILLLGGDSSNVGFGSPGLAGGVSLSIGAAGILGSAYALQAVEVIANQLVMAIFPFSGTGLTASDMPTNTGNKVLYLGNAMTAPTAPSPSGTILWSQNGQLNVMQGNGISFPVGSILNPSICTAIAPSSIPIITLPTNGTVTYSTTITSSIGTPAGALTITVPPNSSIYLEITYVAKQPSSGSSVVYRYNNQVVRDASSTPILDTISITLDQTPFSTGGSWTAPAPPSIAGSNIIVLTGSSSIGSSNWTVITEIIIATA